VVKVIRDEPRIRKLSRIPINSALYSPLSVILIIPHLNISSPGKKNKLKNTVNIKSTSTAFIPRRINLNGTFDRPIAEAKKIKTTIYPKNDLNKKSEIINKKVPNSLTLGSSRCRIESAG